MRSAYASLGVKGAFRPNPTCLNSAQLCEFIYARTLRAGIRVAMLIYFCRTHHAAKAGAAIGGLPGVGGSRGNLGTGRAEIEKVWISRSSLADGLASHPASSRREQAGLDQVQREGRDQVTVRFGHRQGYQCCKGNKRGAGHIEHGVAGAVACAVVVAVLRERLRTYQRAVGVCHQLLRIHRLTPSAANADSNTAPGAPIRSPIPGGAEYGYLCPAGCRKRWALCMNLLKPSGAIAPLRHLLGLAPAPT